MTRGDRSVRTLTARSARLRDRVAELESDLAQRRERLRAHARSLEEAIRLIDASRQGLELEASVRAAIDFALALCGPPDEDRSDPPQE